MPEAAELILVNELARAIGARNPYLHARPWRFALPPPGSGVWYALALSFVVSLGVFGHETGEA